MPMFAPAQKNFSPAPMITITWIDASMRACRIASSSSRIMSYEYVLAGGSSSVIVKMPSAAEVLSFCADIFEVDRLTIDAALRRRDVVGELSGLVDRRHLN